MINKSVIQKETIQSAIVLHIIHYISCSEDLMLFRATLLRFFFFFWFITFQWSTYQSTHIMYIILIKEWVFSLHTSQYFTAKNVQVPRFLIFDQRIWFSPLKKQHMSYGIFTFYQKQKKKCLAMRCSNSLLVEDEIGGKLFWCFYNL